MAATRRHFLRSAVTTAVAVGAVSGTAVTASASGGATSGSAASDTAAGSGAVSANGWPIAAAPDDGGSVWTRPVPGTGFGVAVAIGDVETILVHVVRRFHYEVEALRDGDVIGYRAPATTKGYETNHASGTAVDIRPDCYPAGVKGGFFAPQAAVIRDILADCEGVVKWGGDFTTPDESHFQIDVPPTSPEVKRVADKFRAWNASPGEGAGVARDALDGDRRAAARALQRRQAA
ncbi:M15 family metallopeptidase [Streptomyces sp. YU58]|uniref:M15 family metallopeptidase n=1 Tax=Streptomyces sp. SX92 TaxID=3158972 RepID=UPI0027B97BCB|nr:M15 family metallopeptidase [Streptomyces coralus]WLW53912.1 M15 family metallopeptidase [Streptomyces coralus]